MTGEWVRRGEWLLLKLPAGIESSKQGAEWLEALDKVPTALMRKLLHSDGIRVAGGKLMVRLFPDEASGIEAEWMELETLYEDDFVLVVYKPAGMPVHPSTPGQKGSLAAAVASYYESTGQSCRIRHIHRLDEDTTGPVLYAKNELAHILLDEAMRHKTISREYIAIAEGQVPTGNGLIDAPIGKDRHHNKRRRVSPGGDSARTRYTVVETGAAASLVRLTLETGRTHQIRVHMSYIGHPLVGDSLYGGSTERFQRQALHGEFLSFSHPWSGETIRVHAPIPEDMSSLWQRLGPEAT